MQIVWFFDDDAQVYVCPTCERVANHYTEEKCSVCGGPFVEFKADLVEVQDALDAADKIADKKTKRKAKR